MAIIEDQWKAKPARLDNTLDGKVSGKGMEGGIGKAGKENTCY